MTELYEAIYELFKFNNRSLKRNSIRPTRHINLLGILPFKVPYRILSHFYIRIILPKCIKVQFPKYVLS